MLTEQARGLALETQRGKAPALPQRNAASGQAGGRQPPGGSSPLLRPVLSKGPADRKVAQPRSYSVLAAGPKRPGQLRIDAGSWAQDRNGSPASPVLFPPHQSRQRFIPVLDTQYRVQACSFTTMRRTMDSSGDPFCQGRCHDARGSTKPPVFAH